MSMLPPHQDHEAITASGSYLTLADVIAYTKLSRSTIERRIGSGDLPCYRPAGKAPRRFLRADVDALMGLDVAVRARVHEGGDDDALDRLVS